MLKWIWRTQKYNYSLSRENSVVLCKYIVQNKVSQTLTLLLFTKERVSVKVGK